MGFGTEILFILMLGLLVLGPKQLHTLLGHAARAKAQFEEARRSLKSQLAAELDAPHQEGETDARHELVGDKPSQQQFLPGADTNHEVRCSDNEDPKMALGFRS